MNDLKRTSWTWMLAPALACALIVPAALAEEVKQKDRSAKSEETKSADPAAAPSLRVEEGRTMTNLQTGSMASGAGDKKKVEIPEGQVFTNALLDQLFGASPEEATDDAAATTPTTPGGGSTAPDPLKAMQDQVAEQKQRERMVVDAEKEVDAAKTKLANLEKQLLATKNPFSARPELSDEEKEVRANSGETAEQRAARTAKLVEEARAEVKAAEDKLAALRAGQ